MKRPTRFAKGRKTPVPADPPIIPRGIPSPEFMMAVQLKGWRNLAAAVLLQAARDAGTAHGRDVPDWALSPAAEAWCEICDFTPSVFARAVIVKAAAGGRLIKRSGRGFIVLPEKGS